MSENAGSSVEVSVNKLPLEQEVTVRLGHELTVDVLVRFVARQDLLPQDLLDGVQFHELLLKGQLLPDLIWRVICFEQLIYLASAVVDLVFLVVLLDIHVRLIREGARRGRVLIVVCRVNNHRGAVFVCEPPLNVLPEVVSIHYHIVLKVLLVYRHGLLLDCGLLPVPLVWVR